MSKIKKRKNTGGALVVPVVPDEETTAPDLIKNLNNDCLVKVFKYLPMHQRLTVEEVCKRWKDVAKLAWNDIKALKFIHGDDPFAWKTDSFKLPYKNCTTQCIGNILRRCGGHLKELEIGSPFDAKILPLVGQHCCNLTKLKIDFPSYDKKCVKLLPRMQRLTFFEMERFSRGVPGNFFQTLPYKTLTELHLWGLGIKPSLPHGFFSALPNLEKLTALTLNCFSLEDATLRIIRRQSNLTFLSLARCDIRAELLNFNLLINLEHLNISSLRINDNFLLQLSENNKKLKYLNISGTWTISDNGLRNLQKLCQLEELIVNHVYGISDAGLSRMHNLQKLECEDCSDVFDEGIIELMEHAPNLKYLKLAGSRVIGEVLEAANRITVRRTNNLSLNITVSRRVGRFWGSGGNYSPLLSVDIRDEPCDRDSDDPHSSEDEVFYGVEEYESDYYDYDHEPEYWEPY